MNPLYTDYRVKVFARHPLEGVVLMEDGRLAVYTKMPAEHNLANLDIILQISRHFNAPQKQVVLVRGHTLPNKTIRIYTT